MLNCTQINRKVLIISMCKSLKIGLRVTAWYELRYEIYLAERYVLMYKKAQGSLEQ